METDCVRDVSSLPAILLHMVWLAGNTARCNYVFGGSHCIYLDNWTSDFSMVGGACIATRDGIKINNGKK